MALFEVGNAATASLNLGLVLLIVPVLAEWAKVRKGSTQAFNWIAAAGISFVLASAFSASGAMTQLAGRSAAAGGALLFDGIGFILVLVGALMVLYNKVSEM